MTAGTENMAERWGLNPVQFWLRGEHPSAPVVHDEAAGFWNVYGHPEIIEMFTDPATFSSNTQRVMPPDPSLADASALTEGNLINVDPPEHSKLRKLVGHAFTPRVVANLEPRIAGVTNELLDAATGGDRVELVADLAYPLPVIVIAELLGVPASDRPLFKKWVDGMLGGSKQFSLNDASDEQRDYAKHAMDQARNLAEYFADHIAERRTHPRDDLLTKLVEAEVDGERLTGAEVANFAMVLLIAGHITTTMLLGNTVLCLDTHPDQLAAVRADRSRVPAAIEESLRFFSPFAVLARATMRDVELGGQVIPADSLVMAWLAAANRDTRTFADGDVYDSTRDPNPHVAFGRGIHFCVGAPLARLEGRVAMNILLDRLPTLRTIPDEPPVFVPSPNMTGVSRLPLLV